MWRPAPKQFAGTGIGRQPAGASTEPLRPPHQAELAERYRLETEEEDGEDEDLRRREKYHGQRGVRQSVIEFLSSLSSVGRNRRGVEGLLPADERDTAFPQARRVMAATDAWSGTHGQ